MCSNNKLPAFILPILSWRSQGYIDLSKRRVSPEDVAKCEDRYNKAKAVHSVLRHVADLRGLVLEDLSTKVSWPLYKKYGHAFDAFKLTLQDEEDVFVGLDIDEETKQAMITHIKRRLAPQPSKVDYLASPLAPSLLPMMKRQIAVFPA